MVTNTVSLTIISKLEFHRSKEFTNKKIKVQLGEIKEDCIFEGNPVLEDVSKY